MIQPLESGSAKILAFKLSGQLHDADYQGFVPILDAAVAAQGKVRLLAVFEDFHGWDAQAAWDDFKVGLKHYADIERIAVVGDHRWEKWMAGMMQAFTRGEVKFFPSAELPAAWNWVRATD